MQVVFNTQFERRRESVQSRTRKASTLRNLFSYKKIGKTKENITDTFTALHCGNKPEYEKCLHTNETLKLSIAFQF
jgi:hypothetical protein